MRYLFVWTSAFLFLSPSASLATESQCMLECLSTNMTSGQCRVICDNRQPQAESDFSRTGAIGGIMRAEQHRAQQEKLAAEAQLLKEQSRALELENEQRRLELENQRRAVELSQSDQPKEIPSAGSLLLQGAAGDIIARSELDAYKAAVARRASLFPDFEHVASAPDVRFSRAMYRYTARSTYAADITYYLANHKDTAAQIADMGDRDTELAIKLIEEIVTPPPSR